MTTHVCVACQTKSPRLFSACAQQSRSATGTQCHVSQTRERPEVTRTASRRLSSPSTHSFGLIVFSRLVRCFVDFLLYNIAGTILYTALPCWPCSLARCFVRFFLQEHARTTPCTPSPAPNQLWCALGSAPPNSARWPRPATPRTLYAPLPVLPGTIAVDATPGICLVALCSSALHAQPACFGALFEFQSCHSFSAAPGSRDRALWGQLIRRVSACVL